MTGLDNFEAGTNQVRWRWGKVLKQHLPIQGLPFQGSRFGERTFAEQRATQLNQEFEPMVAKK